MEYLNKFDNKNVLITGGLGFVGNNLAKELMNSSNCKLTIIDNEINSSYEVLRSYNSKFTFIGESIIEANLEILKEFHYIFHLACVQIAHSSKDPFLDLNTNASSTLRLLEYLRRNETKCERFVYTSSASVYGSAQFGLCSEVGATKTLSHYAATKLLGENYTLMYNKLFGLPTTAVRFSNVYGYGQSPSNPYCGVLGKFIHNALSHFPIQIFGDGQQTRDYTFISDAISATLLSAIHPNAIGNVFNVGTGIETSVNELAAWLKSHFNSLEIIHVPPRDIDNIRRRFMDISLIQNSLGWEPVVSIEDGLNQTLHWYKKNAKF